MKKFEFEIGAKNGLHARPSGLLVKEASNFKSDIKIELQKGAGVKEANAKSLFSIMGLAAKKDDILHITVSGEDEEEAAEKMQMFLKEKFSEESEEVVENT